MASRADALKSKLLACIRKKKLSEPFETRTRKNVKASFFSSGQQQEFLAPPGRSDGLFFREPRPNGVQPGGLDFFCYFFVSRQKSRSQKKRSGSSIDESSFLQSKKEEHMELSKDNPGLTARTVLTLANDPGLTARTVLTLANDPGLTARTVLALTTKQSEPGDKNRTGPLTIHYSLLTN